MTAATVASSALCSRQTVVQSAVGVAPLGVVLRARKKKANICEPDGAFSIRQEKEREVNRERGGGPMTRPADVPPPPATLEEVNTLLARGANVAVLTSACMAKRTAALVALLRRLPPTEGIVHVARLDGEVVCDLPAPSTAEWNAYLDSMPEGSLWNKDPGLEVLFDFEIELEEMREALLERMNDRGALQQEVDRLVNRFVAHQQNTPPLAADADAPVLIDEDSVRHLETIATVHHQRMVTADDPGPALPEFYRAVLLKQEGVLASFDASLKAVFTCAQAYNAFLNQNHWIFQMGMPERGTRNGWRQEDRCDNVATAPWTMNSQRVDTTIRTMRRRLADVVETVVLGADGLKSAAKTVVVSEYRALMTRLSQKMLRLDTEIGELATRQEETGTDFAAVDSMRLEALIVERSDMHVRVVEPLVHQFAQQMETSGTETGVTNANGDRCVELAWETFKQFGEPTHTTRLDEYVKAQADAEANLESTKERVSVVLQKIKWDYYVLGTLTVVHEHLAVAWKIWRLLPAEKRPPNAVEPETLLRLFGQVADEEHWRGTPRAVEAVADCVAFLFEWFAQGPLGEDYTDRFLSDSIVQTLAPYANDPNRPSALYVRPVAAPLPSLREAAAALADRANRAQSLVAMAAFANHGVWVAPRASSRFV